jgi:DNA-binding SARP family transcriptional activator
VKSRENNTSGLQPYLPINWREVRKALASDRYQQIDELLENAIQGGQVARESIHFHYLTVASYLCTMCQQCQSEIVRLHQATDEIHSRRRDYEQKLEYLIDVISQQLPFMDGNAIEIPTPISKFHKFLLWCQHMLHSIREIRIPTIMDKKRPIRMPKVSLSGVKKEPGHVFSDDNGSSQTDKISNQAKTKLTLSIYCLGPFRVSRGDCTINKWPSGKGKAILKYIVAGLGRPINKNVLLDAFWRDANPEAARKNLYVAIHGLRQAFRSLQSDTSYVLYYDDHYFLNPDVDVWIDVEEFYRRLQAGQRLERLGILGEAIKEYEAAESLYQGEFLEEDIYEDWIMPIRQDINHGYLTVLEHLSQHYYSNNEYSICIQYCQKMLNRDNCQEDAHRRLMCCYMGLGQRNLALRQYHMCIEALQRELEVPPMQETLELYNQICSAGNV